MDHSASGEYVAAMSRAAPPVVVTGLSVGGLGLQDWVYILTIIYTVLQTGAFLWGIVKARKANK